MEDAFLGYASVPAAHESTDASAMDVSMEELSLDQEPPNTESSEQQDNLLMADADIPEDGGENVVEEDDVEEDWSEEDDRPTRYDLRQYGVHQSLPIASGPPDMQSDCDTAEEYIKRVR